MSSSLVEVESESHLCDLCKELCRYLLGTPGDDSQRAENGHYGATAKLQDSLKLGCHLCSLFWRSFRSAGATDQFALLQASYVVRCSRSLPRIVLTFKLPNGSEYERVLEAHPGRVPSHLKKFTHMQSNSLHTESTSSQACFDLVSSWLHHCLENHPKCSIQDEASSKLPTRLLHLESIEERVQVRLCCDEADEDEDVHYLTLSHCWGKQKMLTLTKSSLEAFKANIPFNELPLTFADAIKVTLKLGFTYLWIDSLCIIQDDTVDWVLESSNMGNIYRNGVCNIAALGAHDDDEGCFAERAPFGFRPLEIHSESRYLHFEPPSPRQTRQPLSDAGPDAVKAPLMDRAWVLQEVVLSPRTIYYGSELLFWECIEGAAFECGPLILRHPSNVTTASVKAVFDNFFGISETEGGCQVTHLMPTWHILLKTYTSAKLTFQADRWLAIAGLAAKLAETAAVSIMAGLWKEALLDELPWVAYEPGTRVPNGSPSWSWLSLNAPIDWLGPDISEIAIDILALPPKCSSELNWTLIKDTASPPDADTISEQHPLQLHGRLRQFYVQPGSVSSGDYPIASTTLRPDILPWPRLDLWGMLYSHDFPLNHIRVLLLVPLDDFGLAWTRVGMLEAILKPANIYNELSRHTAGKMLDEFGPPQTIYLI
jgi:hypothetical protein